MTLKIPEQLLNDIHRHSEVSYPEEGAGLLLGEAQGDTRRVVSIFKIANAREDAARHNRYLIVPQDMLRGEQEAMRQGLEIVGVFHSHPDHPDRPSEFDREWAMPWYAYLITRVDQGEAIKSRAWRLSEDRQTFSEDEIIMIQKANQEVI